MSGTVDYVKVVDHLTDVIKELNQPCVEAPAAPAVPAERTAEERKQDAAIVLRELLHALEQAGDAGAAAAAENGASSEGRKDGYAQMSTDYTVYTSPPMPPIPSVRARDAAGRVVWDPKQNKWRRT